MIKNIRRFSLSILVTILVSACGVKSSESKVINGVDDRNSIELSSPLPSHVVGRLVAKMEGNMFYTCTASFISANLVLTAGHCVMNEDGGLRSQEIRFFPGVFSKPAWDSGILANFVWRSRAYGSSNNENNRHVDWAVLRVDSQSQDWFEVFDGDLQLGALLSTISYPNEKSEKGWTPFSETNCRLNQYGSGQLSVAFWSTCDVTQGASGGPVLAYVPSLNKFYIVGINVAEGNQTLGSFHLKSSYLVREINATVF